MSEDSICPQRKPSISSAPEVLGRGARPFYVTQPIRISETFHFTHRKLSLRMSDSPGVTKKVRNSQRRLQPVDTILFSPGGGTGGLRAMRDGIYHLVGGETQRLQVVL